MIGQSCVGGSKRKMPSGKTILWEVDAQADFMLPGGRLYVPGAEKIIPNIDRLVAEAREGHVFLISSGDAHLPDDPEFGRFPPHCVKGTPGAAIITAGLSKNYLTIPNRSSFALPKDLLNYQQIVIEKQTLDVFDNPKTSELVAQLNDAFGAGVEYAVFGVVTEYCVRCAAKGLLDRGCKVAIVEDAIETLKPEEGRATLEELKALGARLVTTGQVLATIEAAAAPKGA
jgi:nicotinamidase/pyrazinamidase